VKKILIVFLILILLVFLVVVLVLGYLGFFPGVSALFGSNRPRDLGVKYSQADYVSYQQRAGSQTVALAQVSEDGESLKFLGQQDLTASFSEAEVSARISHSLWRYMPFTNFQIRFPGQNLIEFSGILATDRLSGFISEVGGVEISQADIDKGLNYLKIFSKNTPVYAKAEVKVQDNKVDIQMQKLEIGRIPVPLESWDASSSFTNAAQEIIDKVPGLNAKSVTFGDGKMSFTGTVPTQISALMSN
jgi:hypothetical protein